MDRMTLKVEQGALTECPVWESHKRGKNWMALISEAPSAPNGIKRDFFDRARGKFFYLTDGLKVGQPIEFGGDYATGSGHRVEKRWYGVVESITNSEVVLLQFANAIEAIQYAESLTNDTAKHDEQLRKERTALIARIKTIDALLGEGHSIAIIA